MSSTSMLQLLLYGLVYSAYAYAQSADSVEQTSGSSGAASASSGLSHMTSSSRRQINSTNITKSSLLPRTASFDTTGNSAHTSALIAGTSIYNSSGAHSISITTWTNASLGFNACYALWTKYWAESSTHYPSATSTSLTTLTTTKTYSGQPLATSTFTNSAQINTVYTLDGDFTVGTAMIYVASAETHTVTFQAVSTDFQTITETDTAYIAYSTFPSPSCTIPAVVPACQSSWESYIFSQLIPSPTLPDHCAVYQDRCSIASSQPACASVYTASMNAYSSSIKAAISPICSAASISGALCQSVRENWQTGENWNFVPAFTDRFLINQLNYKQSHGSLNVGTAWTWATSATLGVALGCTLGCGRCEVTGGTVQLIYWPEATATATASTGFLRNGTRKASLASPKPTATGIVTAVTLGTTFTSPTIYISYGGVHAADACGEVGTSIGATILAIPTQSTLSSIYGLASPGVWYLNSAVAILTAPFTVADMNEPVPFSIYSSQPICQTSMRQITCNATCATTLPYKPILVVPDQVYRELQPAWATCWGDVHGVYDPPIALTGTSVADGVTITSASTPTSTPAVPSPVPANNPATSTSTATIVATGDRTGPLQSDPAQQDPTTARSATTIVQQATSPIEVVANSKTFLVSQSGNAVDVAISGTTTKLTAGATASLSGEQIAVSPNGAVAIGTGSTATTIVLTVNDDPQQQTIATIGTQAVTFLPTSNGDVLIANGGSTSTLTPGQVATVSDQRISIAADGSVVLGSGSSTSGIILDPQAQTVATVGGQALTIGENTNGAGVVIANSGSKTTLQYGATAVFGGQSTSLATGGSLVIGSGTSATTISLASTPVPSTTLLIGTEKVTILAASNTPGIIVIDRGTTTIIAASSIAVIEGQQVSAATGVAVIGTGSTATTITLASSTALQVTVLLGSEVVTLAHATSGSGIVVVDRSTTTTLAIGSVVAIEGQTFSIASSGIIAIGSGSSASTITIPQTSQETSSSSITKYTGASGRISPTRVSALLACLLVIAYIGGASSL